ncbi:MAG: pentapeptide repeat-containing protein [Anaerolineae bacterium]|nr:pentapeptide repeat-containing protein [Anaerolineae bacterium]
MDDLRYSEAFLFGTAICTEIGYEYLKILRPQFFLSRIHNRVGYGVIEALRSANDNSDVPYKAVFSALNSAVASAIEDNEEQLCSINFPIVVTGGNLFESYLNDSGEIIVNKIELGILARGLPSVEKYLPWPSNEVAPYVYICTTIGLELLIQSLVSLGDDLLKSGRAPILETRYFFDKKNDIRKSSIELQKKIVANFEQGKLLNLRGVNLQKNDLSGALLRGLNLSGANLQEADLSYAYLERADLSKANLHEAYLIRAKLVEANLSRTDLTDAVLISADLTKANLCGANLLGADLCGSNLTEADLRGANLDCELQEVITTGAKYNDQTNLPEWFNREAMCYVS